MKASSNKVITASVTPMSTKEGMEKGEKYNFSVEGYNDSKKDIYYGIYINYGEEQENKQRFNDEDIMIYLTETKNGEKKDVFGPGRLSDFNNNMIYASTIDSNIKKEDKVTRDYELTVWLSDNILVSDTETSWEGKNIYTSEEYKNSYLSLDVKVEGDFVEKGVEDGKVEITAVTATTNTPYDLTTSPESDEDVKVTLTSTKELEKIILINTSTGEKEELTPTENKVEKVISASGKYRYYGIFKDGKISATEEFIVNLLSDKTTTLNKPTNKICIERVYNGDTQELAESTKGYTLENNTGINATTYQVKVKLNEGYTWSDETPSDITIECEIKPKDVEVEWNVVKYTYTGEPQGPTATGLGVKDEILTIETTKETDAGSHVSTATLTKVTNGQAEVKNYNLTNNTKDYEIEKAIPELTLEPVSGSVRVNEEITFKATSNVEGTFKVTSSASSKATATLTPSTGKTTTVTVSGKEIGDANIEVQFESTNPNYSSNKKTYQVTVTEGIQEATLGSCKENLIYDGTSQTLINEGVGVTYNKTTGTNAGDYEITVTPKDGYAFSDGKESQTLTCTIKQKDLTITAKDQTISYGSSISTGTSYITTGDNELVSGHSVYSVSLSQSTSSITSSGTITPSSAVIKAGTSSSSTTVTSNYNITYVKGNLTIEKATPTLSRTPTSGSVYVGSSTTFRVSSNISGTFSVSSSTTSKVRATLSTTSGTSTTVTVTGVTTGSGYVYISFTPTSSNYKSTSTYYYVTVTDPPTPTLVEAVKGTLGQSGGVIGLDPTTGTTCSSTSCKEYRYSGSSVNNYVTFNGETWRILGVFKEGSEEFVKIVRNEVLPASYFPVSYSYGGTTYSLKSTIGDYGNYVYWNLPSELKSTNYNDWTTAGLQYWLNAGFSTSTSSPSSGYLSYLSTTAKNMIRDTKYYLGNYYVHIMFITFVDGDDYTSESAIDGYNHERSNIVCEEGRTSVSYITDEGSCSIWYGNKSTWTGKIGLMYPSDFGFTLSDNLWTERLYYANSKTYYNVPSSIYGLTTDQLNTSWLIRNANHNIYEWLISPSSNHHNMSTFWDNNGHVSGINSIVPLTDATYMAFAVPWGEYGTIDYSMAVRPTLYLKSSVKTTSGTGTSSSPYVLSYTSSSPSVNEGPSIVDDNVGTNKTASIGSCNNLIYNGEEQTLVSGGKNVTYSNNKGTDAGTYIVTANTKNGYFFSDGTTSKTLTCTIEKKTVTVNYSNNEVKYTGGLVSPIATATGVKGESIELETTKESNVGDYTMITTMKSVNPNYTLRNTVYDYKIVDGDVKENNDIKTTYKVNYYLMNKDMINYTLVKSNSYDAKVGESVTGKILEFSGYKSPKSITIEIIKGENIINYYYER